MRNPKHPGWPTSGERTELREVAERWKWSYVDLMHSRHRARVLGTPSERTLADAVREYLVHRRNVVEVRTFAGDQSALRHLQDQYPAGTSVHDLELQPLVDRLLVEGYRPATVRQYRNNLASLWRWLDIPVPRVRIPDPGEMERRCWSDEEVARAREAASGTARLALDIGLFMGCRAGEIFALRGEDLRGTTVRISRQIPQGSTTPKPLKGKRARTAVVLPGWAHEPGPGLILHRNGEPIGRKVQYRMIRGILEAAGLQEVGAGWHMARHAYARMFLELKPDMRLLQASLGHGSVTTTEQAYNWLLPDRAAAMASEAIHGA